MDIVNIAAGFNFEIKDKSGDFYQLKYVPTKTYLSNQEDPATVDVFSLIKHQTAIAKYRIEFYKRSNNIDASIMEKYCKEYHRFKDSYGTGRSCQCYNISIDLNTYYSPLEIKHHIDSFCNDLKDIYKKIAQGNDYIRNKDGDKEDPFDMWGNCIRAYDAYLCKIKLGKKRFYKAIAMELDYYDEDSKACNAIDSAVDRLQENIKVAKVFIERAEQGTFPYGDNGEWRYRHLFKQIKL